MSHATPEHTPTSARERADELRSLAGPVESGADSVPGADAPDATTDPAIDEVREGGDGDLGDDADPYAGRSMPTEPNPTADDPASNLNF